MVAKHQRDGSEDRWKPWFDKGLQDVRLRATYVDVTESGFTSPDTVDADTAKAACCLALIFLTLIILMLLYASGQLKTHRQEIDRLLTDDLMGADDIRKYMEIFQKAADAPVRITSLRT